MLYDDLRSVDTIVIVANHEINVAETCGRTVPR
jgi:hypothetical protein